MRDIEIKTNFLAYDSIDELPDEDQVLLARAKEATLKSYAPYSHFKVGCAIQLENGEVVTGGNQENASYPACLCAERVALSGASTQYPDIAPIKMAIVCKNESKPLEKPAAPCGECRQVLFEFQKRFGQPIELLLRGETGPVYKVTSIADLLPLAFSKEDLIE